MTDTTAHVASHLEAELEYVDDHALVIHLAGRLDICGLQYLRRILRALVPDRPWLVLDVAAVLEFHPSTVTVLAAAQRRLRCHGTRLALWRPRAQPTEVMRGAGFHSTVDVVTGRLDEWLADQRSRKR
jgi:anti-anti-sigma regulatory factor